MNGSELNKIKDGIILVFKENLKDNLFAIVSLGGIAVGYFSRPWSDIDILVVVDELNLETKKKISRANEFLEKEYQCRFGISVITKKEFQDPFSPAISMEGKNLQTLLDLKKSQERLIFCKDKQINKIYCPSEQEIKEYSISNFAMFLLRNRRTLTKSVPKTFEEYKKIVEKEVRAGFIMTKLAIQHFSLYNCRSNKEIFEQSEKIFNDFDFSVLEDNLRVIDRWGEIKEKSQLDEILEVTDSFIESLSRYIFEKLSK